MNQATPMPAAEGAPGPHARPRKPKFLIFIGICKLLKAAFLVTAAFAVLHFINHDIGLFVRDWADKLRLDPGGPRVQHLVAHLMAIHPKTFWLVSLAMFVYAALYAIEGVGLLLDKTWAEWMTVVTTAGFIPLEIYEIERHTTLVRIGLLVFNVIILSYLVYYVRRKIKRHRAEELAHQDGASQPGKPL